MRARAKTTPGGLDVVYNQGSVHDASSKEQFAAFEHNWQRGGLGFMSAFGDLMMELSANDIAANFVRNKIRATVNDPATAETLCPKNIIGAKRLCVDIDYFQTYNRENVELIDVSEKPIEAITPSGIRAHGIEHQIDALVIATGFDAMTGALTRVDIRGRGTTPLAKRWKTVRPPISVWQCTISKPLHRHRSRSPSVFSNMLPTIEQHVDWIADCLGHAQKNGYKTIEADAEAERVWWAHCRISAKSASRRSRTAGTSARTSPGKRGISPYFGGIPAYFKYAKKLSKTVTKDSLSDRAIMDYLDRVKEEFTRQADTFAVHAVKADEKVESRFQGAIGDAGKGVLLDVACGPGVVTAALAQNAARITAFDATPAMLEKARARCEEAGLANVKFREGDAQAMPFADATFDGIVTRLAIHHFAEPAKVMSEMYRVLKPGGRAVIVDVIVSDNSEEAALQNAIEIIRDPSHIRMLPEAELFGGIIDAGFTIQDISGWDKDREFEEWCGIANDARSESDRCAPSPALSRETAGTQGSDFP